MPVLLRPYEGRSVEELAREPHLRGEVRGPLLLTRHLAIADQRALRDELVALGFQKRREPQRARLAAVELERREELDALDGAGVEAGREQRGQLGEGLDAHRARQDRRAVDAVVREERLLRRVEDGLDFEPALRRHREHFSDHRAALRDVDARGVESVALLEQHAQRARHHDLAARPRVQLAQQRRDALFGRQRLDAGHLHHLRDRSARGHADARPRGPVELQALARDALREQIVGRAVVGLAAVAEAAGDGAERHHPPDFDVAERVEQVEEAVRLDVEDAGELVVRLVGKEAADLEAGAVQEEVGARDRGERLLHCGCVAEIGLGPVRDAACGADGADGLRARGEPLDARQLSLDRRGRELLSLRAIDQRLLERLAVAHEVGVGEVGLGEAIDEPERAAALRQLAGDRGDDAARGAADHERAVELRGLAGGCGRLADRDREALRAAAADLDRSRIAQRLLDQRGRDFFGGPRRVEVHDLDGGPGPLARERFDEAADGAPHRRGRSADAAQPAHARAGDDEARRVERARRFGERLHAPREAVVPGGGGQRLDRPFVVERREPEEAVDRAFDLLVEPHDLGAARLQLRDERIGHAARVGHHRHALQRDARRLAQLQRRAQHWHRNAARERARLHRPRRVSHARGLRRPPLLDEAHDVPDGREVAQLELRVARNAPRLAHRRERLGLLDGVDAQIRFEVEIEIEHLGRIAGLLREDGEHFRRDVVDRCGRRLHRLRLRSFGRRGAQLRLPRVDEADHVPQRGEVAQLELRVALDAVRLAHGRERLGLLDGVDPEIRLEVEVQVEHLGRIPGLLRDDREHLLRHVVARGLLDRRRRFLRLFDDRRQPDGLLLGDDAERPLRDLELRPLLPARAREPALELRAIGDAPLVPELLRRTLRRAAAT